MSLMPTPTNSRRSSTAVTSSPALVVGLLLGGFSLCVALFGLSPASTLAGLPLVISLAYVLVRVRVGLPPTLAGVQGRLPTTNRGKKRFLLVTMPINHFGEKLRWCMDWLGVSYEESTVAGILSVFLRGRSVPWLVDRLSCSHLGNSDEALWYLSAVHVPTLEGEARLRADRLLQRTPETMSWEARLNEVGHAVQGWAYYYLLAGGAKRDVSLRLWGGHEPKVPVLQRLIICGSYPLWKALMRKAFGLSSAGLRDRRRAIIEAILDDVDAALARSGGPYLMGQDLTYVDIGVCTLLGPLLPDTVSPLWAQGRFASFAPLRQHPSLPAELRDFELALLARPCGQYIDRTYRENRTEKFVSTSTR